MNELLTIYFFGINVIGFSIFAIDKRKAIKHKQRISESILWMIALLGGALGCYVSMHIMRHKNRKPIFLIGIAFLVIVNVIVFIYLLTI